MNEVRRTVTTPYHPAANLDSPERMAALLDAAHEDRHPIIIAAALGAIAVANSSPRRSRGDELEESIPLNPL